MLSFCLGMNKKKSFIVFALCISLEVKNFVDFNIMVQGKISFQKNGNLLKNLV